MAAAPPAALPPWTVASAGAKKTLKMRSKSYANLAGVRSHPYGAQSSGKFPVLIGVMADKGDAS